HNLPFHSLENTLTPLVQNHYLVHIMGQVSLNQWLHPPMVVLLGHLFRIVETSYLLTRFLGTPLDITYSYRILMAHSIGWNLRLLFLIRVLSQQHPSV